MRTGYGRDDAGQSEYGHVGQEPGHAEPGAEGVQCEGQQHAGDGADEAQHSAQLADM